MTTPSTKSGTTPETLSSPAIAPAGKSGAAGPATATVGPVADLFSSYVAAAAISAAHEIGLLDRIQADGWCHTEEFDTDGRRADPAVLRSLLYSLAWAGIVEIDSPADGADGQGGQIARPGPRFAEAYATRGYFYWLVRGCGELFSIAPALSWQSGDRSYRRDMRAVAIGSRLIGDVEVEPLFDRVLDRLQFGCVADLGCGSGQRLIRIARRNPGVRGIGVDIAPASVELATSTIREAGLADRLSVRRGDVHELGPDPAFAEVDVITCVFMGHDFWPYDRCVATLSRLREAFPRAQTLLLCDVTRSDEVPGGGTPIFRLGFEAAHALMNTYLPTLAEWGEALRASGWTPRAIHHTTAPPGGILFELTPDRTAATA